LDVHSVKVGAAMLAFGILLIAGGLLVVIIGGRDGADDGFYFVSSGQNGLLFFGLGILTVLVGLANLHGGLTTEAQGEVGAGQGR